MLSRITFSTVASGSWNASKVQILASDTFNTVSERIEESKAPQPTLRCKLGIVPVRQIERGGCANVEIFEKGKVFSLARLSTLFYALF